MNDTQEIISIVLAFLTMFFKETIINKYRNSKHYIKQELMKIIKKEDLLELQTLFGSYAVILLHNGYSAINKQYKKATTLHTSNPKHFWFRNEIIIRNDLLYAMVYEGKDLENNAYVYVCDNLLLVVGKDCDIDKLKETNLYKYINRLCKTSYTN